MIFTCDANCEINVFGASHHHTLWRKPDVTCQSADNVKINTIDHLRANPELSGVFNVTGPEPIPNTEFMKMLRKKYGVPFGLPLPTWMLKMGAWVIRTETELILKSRRVVPGRVGYRV